jgi:hypothetical protein
MAVARKGRSGDIETLSQKSFFRALLSLLAIVISVLLAWTSWWFIETITIKEAFGASTSETWLNIVSWILPFGLILAAIASAVGAIFIGLRHSRAMDMLIFSTKIAVVFLIVTLVNILFVANDTALLWFSHLLS